MQKRSLLLTLFLCSSCISVPKTDPPPIQPSAYWKQRKVTLHFDRLPKATDKHQIVYQEELLEFVESKNFFASINRTPNPDFEFYLEFKDCDYGAEKEISGPRMVWRFVSILTWTLVPYWEDEGRCLSVTSVAMKKPIRFQADSAVYSQLFLLPVSLWKGMGGNDTRLDRNLIEIFLARLHKIPKKAKH